MEAGARYLVGGRRASERGAARGGEGAGPLSSVDLNSDLGEGYGAYACGDDAAILADRDLRQRGLRPARGRSRDHGADLRAGEGARRRGRRPSGLPGPLGLRPPPDAVQPAGDRAAGRLPDRRRAGARRLFRPPHHLREGARRAGQHRRRGAAGGRRHRAGGPRGGPRSRPAGHRAHRAGAGGRGLRPGGAPGDLRRPRLHARPAS